ncbi:polysaccharide deacteylase family 2 protein [Pseudorhodobacter wandonensis]|uniref:polysaccharide deacteylase family 2 protein n=1 Tax=Pseudorhodobacter wandonensis TaxID=1120568 RepID=UPI00067D7CD0|nr:divergent polysaccharide deacetylase family protein [Pseudorhodobacter wandonensis]
MSRGFLAGAGWGTVVAGLGLVVASQVTDLGMESERSAAVTGESAVTAPAVVEPAASPLVQEPAVTLPAETMQVPDVPENTAPAMPLPNSDAEAKPDVPQQTASPSTVTPPATVGPEKMGADTLGSDDLGDVAANTPEVLPEAKTALDARPEPVSGLAPIVPSSENPAPNEAAMAVAEAPQPAAADVAPESGQSVVEPSPEAIPAPQTEPEQATGEAGSSAMETAVAPEIKPDTAPAETEQPAIKAPEAGQPDVPVPEAVAPEVEIVVMDPPASRPAPGFTGVDGVTTGRLPSIGAIPATSQDPATAADIDLPPIERFARKFENTSQKPLFAILLRDTGGPDIDREALAAIPFPVSFVIDPTLPDAAVAADIYRAAGQEILILGSGIPAGATASDLAVSLEAMDKILPEAVGVVDQEADGFQGNRTLATQVLALVADQGRGLISWDKGLNAAAQVAQREGVRNAVIFRSMDGADEKSAVIRRYLDRAAFKAAQDGRVVVEGTTRPETVKALLEWAVEGRAATVAIAPATAVMTSQ